MTDGALISAANPWGIGSLEMMYQRSRFLWHTRASHWIIKTWLVQRLCIEKQLAERYLVHTTKTVNYQAKWSGHSCLNILSAKCKLAKYLKAIFCLMSLGQMSIDQISIGQMSVCQMSVCQMSVCQMPVCQMSVCQMSVCQMSVCQMSVCQISFRKIWVGKVSVRQLSVGQMPVGNVFVS